VRGEASPGRRDGQDARDPVVADDAGHFLDQGGVVGQVGAPGGRRDGELLAVDVHGRTEGAQGVDDLGLGVLDTDQLGRPGQAHGHDGPRGGVHQRRPEGVGPAAGELDEELHRAVGCGLGHERVHAALEATGGLARELVTPGSAGDGDLVEAGGLDQDVRGARGDLGAGTAHDAGEPDGALVVGDDEVLGVERPGDVVERRQGLPRGRTTDAEPTPHGGEVVPVQGLPELEHDVVRDVDRQRDGADADE
jgi:hypothetical protein